MPEFEFRHVNGHVEVMLDGRFYCSADTMAEARNEVTSDLKEEQNEHSFE